MADLTVQSVDEDGLEATYNSAASAGDTFTNTGDVILHVKNTNGATRVITVTAQTSAVQDVPGMGTMTHADATMTISATTGELFMGPFPTHIFNTLSGANAGKASITYSAVAGVTVAVLRVRKIV